MKAFSCSVCSAAFTTNGSLTRHMATHTSVKPYKCPFCEQGFRTTVHCKKHMKRHQAAPAVAASPGEAEGGGGITARLSVRGLVPGRELASVSTGMPFSQPSPLRWKPFPPPLAARPPPHAGGGLGRPRGAAGRELSLPLFAAGELLVARPGRSARVPFSLLRGSLPRGVGPSRSPRGAVPDGAPSHVASFSWREALRCAVAACRRAGVPSRGACGRPGSLARRATPPSRRL